MTNYTLFDFSNILLNYPSREKAALWLSDLQYHLQKQEKLKSDDQELVIALSPGFVKELEDAKLEGKIEGKIEANVSVVKRLLSKRFGNLTPQLQQQISQLSVDQLEDLSERMFEKSNLLLAATLAKPSELGSKS
jgi:hypothetical protein